MRRSIWIKAACAAAVIGACGIGAWFMGVYPGGAANRGHIHTQEGLALHFFINRPPSSALPDPASDIVRAAIEEEFEVQLTVTAMEEGDEYNTTIASLLAANDPPDMWLNISPDGGAKYTLDNVLADMTYYVTPETMPNYFRYWMNEMELREYQVHNKFARAPIPYDNQSYRAYYIRQDWLQKLGLKVPATYEEYVDTLRAFTYDDPDGNGIDDTYGFTTAGNGVGLSQQWPEFIKHGLIYPAYFKDDRLIDMGMDERVGAVIEDILHVMEEGVVDPDWFLNKGDQHVDKAVQGRVGVILGDTADFAYDSNPDSLQSRSRAVNPDADWVPFNPFGSRPLRTEAAPGFPFVFSNNAAGLHPEKLKRTARILDWLAGEEGFLLTHYGVEGQHYTRQGNTITIVPEAVGEEKDVRGDFMKVWSFFTPNKPEVYGITVIDPRVTERDKQIRLTIEAIPMHEGLGTTLTPPLGINVEAMRTRQNELQVKMLFSDRSAAKWPEYRQEVLTQFHGDTIFHQYEQKIRAAHLK
ncbi:extracellular solute-binding protein [Paenibacillus sp. J5C_2022]|uniref:extracellular solute-binding protein n=1 Tax=Paenibacillus sp. J5C2022 TaxID=2977129 RepID=UPI0021D17CFD|nr:extracellular solute-binding protein [Paenibacillus sp. J5C2022]MCU6710557.1 extracellular solute-binding protein [Paenibacillus sp. J5C2022]